MTRSRFGGIGNEGLSSALAEDHATRLRYRGV